MKSKSWWEISRRVHGTILIALVATCLPLGIIGLVKYSHAAIYYVAVNGNDANPGTESQPWRNIQKAADTLVAGDKAFVKAGVYYEEVAPQNSGTPGNLITYKANPGDRVVVDGQGTRTFGFNLLRANYIRVEGFEITGVTGHGILVCWAETCGRGFEIINNKIHDNPNCDYCAGVYTQVSQDGLIEGNEIYDNGGDGIGIGGQTTTIRNNIIYNNAVDGIKGGASNLLIVEGNIIHSMTSGVNHGDCMQIMGPCATVIIRNNTTWDCTTNILIDDYSPTPGTSTWGDVYIYNNVVYNSQYVDISNEGFYNGIVAGPRYNNWNSLNIFNNTLINLNDGNGGIGGSGVSSDGFRINTVRIFNNLFYNSINGFHPDNNVSEDYNIYFNNKRDWYMPGWITLPEFQANHPTLEQHSIYADPLIIRYAFPGPDLHLEKGSPAIDAGMTLPAINSISFNFDRENISRPQGSGWDIGAYEFVSGRDMTSPVPPTGLAVY